MTNPDPCEGKPPSYTDAELEAGYAAVLADLRAIRADPRPEPGYTDTWNCHSNGLPNVVPVPPCCGACGATGDLTQHHVRAPGLDQRWALCPEHDTDLPDLPRAPCTGTCGTTEEHL